VAAFAGVDAGKGETVTETRKSAVKNGTKREAIRRKVADSKADLARTQPAPAGPPEGLRALAADYPFALVMGGVALGVLAGALLPRSALGVAAGRKLSKRAAALAGIAGELGLAYGRQALKAAGEAKGKAGEISGTVGESAADYSRKAAELVGDAAASAREAGITIGRQAIRLGSHLRH